MARNIFVRPNQDILDVALEHYGDAVAGLNYLVEDNPDVLSTGQLYVTAGAVLRLAYTTDDELAALPGTRLDVVQKYRLDGIPPISGENPPCGWGAVTWGNFFWGVYPAVCDPAAVIPPEPPASVNFDLFEVTTTRGQATFTWSVAEVVDVTDYALEYSADGLTGFSTVGTQAEDGTGSYSLTIPQVAGFYRLQARNNGDFVAFSDVIPL